MTLNRTALVYGERVQDLLPGLLAFRDSMELGVDGRFHGSVVLEPEVGAPMSRAMMRVEAELLCEDADELGATGGATRTPEQRAFDALVRLAEAVGSAATTTKPIGVKLARSEDSNPNLLIRRPGIRRHESEGSMVLTSSVPSVPQA